MSRLSKKDLRNIIDLLKLCETYAPDHGYMYACAPVSAWTSGSGRFTKPRATPPHCYAVDREAAAVAAATEFFRANQRRRRVIVCDCDAIGEALGYIVETPDNLALREELREVLRKMRKEIA